MTREEVYKRWGPMLLEAITLIIKDEINLLRTNSGLPERTNAQILTAIDNKLKTLNTYEWMNKGE